MSGVWIREGKRDPFPGVGGAKAGRNLVAGREGGGCPDSPGFWGGGGSRGVGEEKRPRAPRFGGVKSHCPGVSVFAGGSRVPEQADKGGGGISVPPGFGEGEQRVRALSLGRVSVPRGVGEGREGRIWVLRVPVRFWVVEGTRGGGRGRARSRCPVSLPGGLGVCFPPC